MKKLSFHFLSDPSKHLESQQSTVLFLEIFKNGVTYCCKKANFDSKMPDVSYGCPYSTWYSLTFMARHQTNRVVLCPFFFVWNGSINLAVVASSAQFSSAQQCWALWCCSEVNWSHVPVYLSLEHLVPHHGIFFFSRKEILLWLLTFFHTLVWWLRRKITLGFCDKCVRDERVVYKLAYWTRIGFR